MILKKLCDDTTEMIGNKYLIKFQVCNEPLKYSKNLSLRFKVNVVNTYSFDKKDLGLKS